MRTLSLQYQLSVKSWQQHLFAVELKVPEHNEATLTFALPSWIPGSYMIRDFAKSITEITFTHADTGAEITAQKIDKQTWEVATNGDGVIVDYVVYANDLSVRSAFINHEYAFINGTSAFLNVVEMSEVRCTLQIEKPAQSHWQAHTGMTPIALDSNPQYWAYESHNYAEFIDHPIFIGECETLSYEVDGVTFELVFSGSHQLDLARIAQDLKPICRHHMALFDHPQPVSRYVFMTLLAENGFGGLEHRNSTALLYPRHDLPRLGDNSQANKTDGYITFLSLCSHELFHTWHVKRIKPDVMVTPKLGEETYTNQLWIYEGFTSFYDDLTLARAKLIDGKKYLDIVAQNISRLLQNAGRYKQSVAQSSFDAWTKFYKQDASATNNIVSYYTKGGIIAFGLDLLLRHRSNQTVSLDTVMKRLWEIYGRDECGTPDNVIATLCQQEFDIDVNDYLDSVVYGTDDVPLETWLDDIGVKLHTRSAVSAEDKGGYTGATEIRHQLGATCKPAAMGLSVIQVFEGLAASKAGVMINDIILALNNQVVNQAKLQRLLDCASDTHVTLTLIRDGQIVNVALPVLQARQDRAYFTIENEEKFQQWLDH